MTRIPRRVVASLVEFFGFADRLRSYELVAKVLATQSAASRQTLAEPTPGYVG